MRRDASCVLSEAVEFVRSARGLWDGRGWVPSESDALQYPSGTRRAEVARRIVEDQTGLRCWVQTATSESNYPVY